jgi:hypothetical protein
VAATIIMGLVRCIDVPLEDRERFGRKGEFENSSAIEIFEKTFDFAPIIFVWGFDPCGKESHRHLYAATNSREE